MSIWYRAAQTENINDVFSGEGGLYVAGRWNYKGRKVIYCSQSISLCTLEWLSHNGLSVSGFSYYRFTIDIPSKLTIQFSISDLPKVWTVTPSIDETRDFAEKFLFNDNKYLAMVVPSVIVPEEFNLIVNPLHASYIQVKKSIGALGQFVAPKRLL